MELQDALRGDDSMLGGSATPAPASPMSDVDANLLLAETDAILATLDAAVAFAASRAGESTPHRTNPRQPKRAGPGSPALTTARSTEARPAKAKARAPARDKVREELAELRAAQEALEAQLLSAQQQQTTAIALRETHAQTWRMIIERQLRMRQLAESDNLQLKVMLRESLKCGGDLSQAWESLRVPNYMCGPPKRPLSIQKHSLLASVFEPLLQRLDKGYAEMDTLFREIGMDQRLLEARSTVAKKSAESQIPGVRTPFMELVEVRLTPFAASLFADVTWRCNRKWHFKDDPYVYPCGVSAQYETFAVNYRMSSTKAFAANESVNFSLVMRRYREAERSVTVFATQCDGELGLTGASSSDIGWLVVSDARLANGGVSPFAPSPAAVVQSCVRITLSGSEQVGEAKVSRLIRCLMAAFEEDVAFIRHSVDSALLLASRSEVALLPSDAASVRSRIKSTAAVDLSCLRKPV